LSFGHAVFFGLGGFLTAHAMNAARGSHAQLPLEVFPIVGGVTGLVFGIIFGCRVHAPFRDRLRDDYTWHWRTCCVEFAHILRYVFGGEEGITVDRTRVLHLFGISFGPQIQVYYLIAAGASCRWPMYALTRTPFGRICNAVRDNPDRARFIGYNTTMVRFLAFSLAGLFAGIAGGLAALNFEIVTSSARWVRPSPVR
jgi:branched-chain amino acid transport system permease protein